VKNKTKAVYLFLLFFAHIAFAQGPSDEDFTDFINNDRSGSNFEDAVALDNICDYRQCKTRDCLEDVFDKTILRQELQYLSDTFGEKGKDWDVIGYDEVDAYTFTQDRYYDDLGIQLFATGENKVLHFDITSSAEALKEREYYLRNQ